MRKPNKQPFPMNQFSVRYQIYLIPIIVILLSGISEAGQFKVTRVYDGDTFKATGHDIEIKVRMVGIDAPETSKRKNQPGQPFSDKAKKRL
jgi:endonuclease YncB( thermonuclease family)